jgi:prepilin peptidase CpaA
MPSLGFNNGLTIAMVALLAFALLSDLRERRIPNAVVVTGLLVGLAGHAWLTGVGGLVFAASGALAGLLCLLPFYISGALGAGDVKLMAMCGAFLGPLQVAVASVASLLVGGLIGIVWAFWQFSAGDSDRAEDEAPSASLSAAGNRMAMCSNVPYGLAIGAGVLVALKATPMLMLTLKGGVPS